MSGVKHFQVFGEPIEILISGEMTGGLSATLTQTSPPGGGPPPHSHKNEDETFYVLEGEYEVLHDNEWVMAGPGDVFHAKRGSVHTFRNIGSTAGKMLVFVTPSGLEEYLEKLSAFSMPKDMAAILALSARYGVSFSG